jgi:YNFM family putative membrane transporter
MALVAAALFTRSLPPSRHFHARPFDLRGLPALTLGMFRDQGLPWLFAEGFLLLGAFVTVYNYIGYRLMAPPYRLSQTAVGLIFSVYLVGTLSSTGIGHLAGKLGRRKVLWAMFVVMLAGVALTAAAQLWLIVAGIVVVTFGFFGGHSIVSSWVGRRAGPAKANAAAMYLFAYYMGSSLAGALGGVCYTVAGWRGVTMFVTMLWGTGLLIAWRLYYLRPLSELERQSRLIPSV